MDGQEKKEETLIGISSRSTIERESACETIAQHKNYRIAKFDDVIFHFMSQLLGIDQKSLSNPDVQSTYLGKEWSYVIHQTFNENGKILTKPVRYYLSPKQIFKRLKYDIRTIHADFWVNAYFNIYKLSGTTVIAVQYPNQADAILERGGKVIRLENLKNNSPAVREDLIMENYEKFTQVIKFSNLDEMHKKIIALI